MTATAPQAGEPRWFADRPTDGLIRLAVADDAPDDALVSAVDFLLGSDAKNWTVTAVDVILEGYDAWELVRDLRVV